MTVLKNETGQKINENMTSLAKIYRDVTTIT